MQLPVRRFVSEVQLTIPRILLSSVGIFASFLISQYVYALESDHDQPVHLEADRAVYNQQTGVTVYTGNVVITQGTIRLQADSVIANLDQNKSIKDVTATGKPAKFQQKINPDKGIVYGEGDQVFYDAKSSQVTLTGNAKLNQDGSSFVGNTLRYGMTQGDIEGNGNAQQRVQMVIPPSATRTPSSVKSK
ncbi:lipopolysaccharide transport periplasmic protein LptA [Aquirhabdus parva]|uniref:Lipopolysaccharide export system protein LptA n=1 Tax=Aquirhabdus parva TaxID=2283318 RepID=A0A345P5W5_9GAMM|nr:lipopolysaccharide transport periplasmic protein LptA [Aquirhabdus parva]AXI02674.1 lipopolysaccharide transport periplasmic protein LptA [Aquirhabdus parva]